MSFFVMLLSGIVDIANMEIVGKSTAVPADQECNRECLKGFVTKYLDAMIAHNPESLPVAAGVRFTEDFKELKLGEGLWKKNIRFDGLPEGYPGRQARGCRIVSRCEGSRVACHVCHETESRWSKDL
jgi:hypothetical protein